MDTGSIAYQERFPIEITDTGLTVNMRCIRVGVPLVVQLVDTSARDPAQIPAVEQDLSLRSFFGAQIPQGGHLSWNLPAASVNDFVRACDFSPLTSPWGHPTAEIAGRELDIVRLSPTGWPADRPAGTTRLSEDGYLFVACTDEWVRVETVIDRGVQLSAVEAFESRRGESNP